MVGFSDFIDFNLPNYERTQSVSRAEARIDFHPPRLTNTVNGSIVSEVGKVQ